VAALTSPASTVVRRRGTKRCRAAAPATAEPGGTASGRCFHQLRTPRRPWAGHVDEVAALLLHLGPGWCRCRSPGQEDGGGLVQLRGRRRMALRRLRLQHHLGATGQVDPSPTLTCCRHWPGERCPRRRPAISITMMIIASAPSARHGREPLLLLRAFDRLPRSAPGRQLVCQCFHLSRRRQASLVPVTRSPGLSGRRPPRRARGPARSDGLATVRTAALPGVLGDLLSVAAGYLGRGR